jgi:hypothetical protein
MASQEPKSGSAKYVELSRGGLVSLCSLGPFFEFSALEMKQTGS